MTQISNASQMVKLEKDPHAAFALIIDGKMLTFALEDDMKYQFLNLAVDCASVICCRVSPKQKALVKILLSVLKHLIRIFSFLIFNFQNMYVYKYRYVIVTLMIIVFYLRSR